LPFKGGCVLIADRQNTFDDLTAESTEKIFYLSQRQAVVAGCGATDSIKRIVHTVEHSTSQTPVSLQIQNNYKQYYKELLTNPFLDKETKEALRDVEFLVIETQGANISFYRIIDGLQPVPEEKINQRGEIVAIGSEQGQMILQPQLVLAGDLRERELDEVIEFGQALIAYASLTDKKIGDPTKYGVDAAVVHQKEQGVNFEKRQLIAKYGMERRLGFRWQNQRI